MKTKFVLLMILTAVVLSACVQKTLQRHKTSPVKPWKIHLVVKSGGGEMDAKSSTGRPMDKCRNDHAGCMVFANNEKGKIIFELKGSDAGFYITKLKICLGATPPADLDDNCPLPLANALEFYVLNTPNLPTIPNLSTGVIGWDYTDNIKSFVLHNRNVLEQQYYYLVEACNASDTCLKADPPLDNKGVKH